MKTKIILLLLAAVITVSFTVIGKSALSPKYSSEDKTASSLLQESDLNQFN
jgi:uncharacterized protein YpmB